MLETFFLNEDFIWLYRCQSDSARSFLSLLWSDPMHGTYSWRPMLQLWFAANFALFGWNVWPYHVEIWLIHLGCAFAVYALASRWRGPWFAALAALVFLLHPLHVQSLAWASAAASPVSTVGVLFVLAASFRNLAQPTPAWGALCAAAVSFFGALLALESALVALVWVPLLAVGTLKPRPSVRKVAALCGVLALVACAFALLRGYASSAVWFPPSPNLPATVPNASVLSSPVVRNFAAALESLVPVGIPGSGLVVHLFAAVLAGWRATKGDYAPLAFLLCFLAAVVPYTPLFFGMAPRHFHLALVPWSWFWASLIWSQGVAAGRWSAVAALGVLACWFAAAWPATRREGARYRELGQLTQTLLGEIRRVLPQIPSGATVAVAGLGPLRLQPGVFVFGLEEALRLVYRDDQLRVDFVPLGALPKGAVLLVYDGKHFHVGS